MGSCLVSSFVIRPYTRLGLGLIIRSVETTNRVAHHVPPVTVMIVKRHPKHFCIEISSYIESSS